jgi:hypothetical protein
MECCGISLQETRRFDLYQFRPNAIERGNTNNLIHNNFTR